MRFGTLPVVNSEDYALVAVPVGIFDRFILSLLPGHWEDHNILGAIRVIQVPFKGYPTQPDRREPVKGRAA